MENWEYLFLLQYALENYLKAETVKNRVFIPQACSDPLFIHRLAEQNADGVYKWI